ncbi:MAG: methionine--tRNA ligase [Candidatus Micrarchaeota archaeon]|nr:methionine--tRNA ligase [Candidatus Micrarchaeota archaeon]
MRTIVAAALPYAYSIPHLGNFVGSILAADVYSKYLKMKGEDFIFISGSDQHGTPVELRAIREKIDPEKLAESMHEEIKALFEKYGCTFTHYGKTHSKANMDIVYEITDALDKNGYIITVEQDQAYCNVDRRFLTDRLIEGTCPYCESALARGDQCDNCGHLLTPAELIKPHCTICGKSDIKFVKARNMALSMDKLQKPILKFVESSRNNNWSKNAYNKSLSYIKEGLKPRDITRNMRWGIPVNRKGFEDNVFYVWYDGLAGYIGITKEWNAKRWKDYWLSEDTRLVHFMGKDNIEFHTTMWPAMLIGSKMGFTLPATIRASEHLISKKIKFSKSRGVGLNLNTALHILPSDYWRFALMHMYPETADTEFTKELLVEVVNKLMNDKIGNLIHRVLTISKNNSDRIDETAKIDAETGHKADEIITEYRDRFEKFDLRGALNALLELADYGNELMSSKEPWALAKKAAADSAAEKEFTEIMGSLLNLVYYVSVLLYPFSPDASGKALSYFGIMKEPDMKLLSKRAKPDLSLEITPIFSKVSKEALAKLEKQEQQ